MKLIPNQKYKTVNGMYAKVSSIVYCGHKCVLNGHIENKIPVQWDENGTLRTLISTHHRYDLINTWSNQDTINRKHSPFDPNGCTLFPEGNWGVDCMWHDLGYWWGGSKEDRLMVDRELVEALRQRGRPIMANIVWLGVRIGGMPQLPTPWHWGSGFIKDIHSYKEQSFLLNSNN